ncbi:unnamed protein product [Arabis nemorensis]|uniref:CCHC-type domain-containing protein n=1 Tax=Arabis nemorensis TaxID=586526 RepID=A0A565AUP9_9BRAS|nr:unnamed protein product [Arabis nemorensis]
MGIRHESYRISKAVQDSRALGPSRGYGIQYSSPTTTWCRLCGLNGHVSYFYPTQNWKDKVVSVICAHCGRERHRGSECPIIHPEITFIPTMTQTTTHPSSSGPASFETLGGRLCSRCRYPKTHRARASSKIR